MGAAAIALLLFIHAESRRNDFRAEATTHIASVSLANELIIADVTLKEHGFVVAVAAGRKIEQ